MSTPLMDLLDPWRAVDNHSVIAGCLPISSLARIRGLLLDPEGDARFRLAFFRDETHRAVLRCEVAATLRLRCQRCLGELDHKVDADTLLALVSGIGEERQLPEAYDPLMVSDKPIRPRDLIEDELLLALPQIPMHDAVICAEHLPNPEAVQALSSEASPFAVLTELKGAVDPVTETDRAAEAAPRGQPDDLPATDSKPASAMQPTRPPAKLVRVGASPSKVRTTAAPSRDVT